MPHVGLENAPLKIDGLNVLHFQLEGSEDEVVDAYAASLVSCNSYRYSTGTLKDRELERMIQEIKAMSGTLKVKSFQSSLIKCLPLI